MGLGSYVNHNPNDVLAMSHRTLGERRGLEMALSYYELLDTHKMLEPKPTAKPKFYGEADESVGVLLNGA